MGCIFGSSEHDENERIEDINKSNRSCTDLLCILLFIIFSIVMSVIVYTKGGDMKQIINAVDYQGNLCQGSKSLGYWPNPTKFGIKLCTDNCDITQNKDAMYEGITYKSFKAANRFCLPDIKSPDFNNLTIHYNDKEFVSVDKLPSVDTLTDDIRSTRIILFTAIFVACEFLFF